MILAKILLAYSYLWTDFEFRSSRCDIKVFKAELWTKKKTNQAWPSVSITQKSMIYRDTEYIKNMNDKL